MKKKGMLSRFFAFAVSIMMAVAFMPLFEGSWSFAEEDADGLQAGDEILADGIGEIVEAEEEVAETAAEPEQTEPDLQAPDAVSPEEEAAAEPKTEGKEGKQATQGEFRLMGIGDEISIEDPQEIVAGEPALCQINEEGAVITYQFTAPNDGKYAFYSSAAPEYDGVDTLGAIAVYDSEGIACTVIDESDDYEGRHFRIDFNAEAGQTYYLQAKLYDSDDTGAFYVTLEEDIFDASIQAEIDKETGTAMVTGTATGDTFDSLYVDGEKCDVDISGKEEFTAKINMKNYDVGYHDLYAVLTEHSDEDFWVYNAEGVPTYIYKAPTNKVSYYSSGKKKIQYTYGGSTYKNCKIVLEYKKAGGSWKKTKAITPGKKYTQSKLAVGKKYSVRAYYVVTQTYKGKTYQFTGKKTGKVSKAVAIKTAGAKPKIKSVKFSGVKVTSSTYRQPVWSYQWIGTMLYMYISGYRTVTEYTTTATVKVTLKKKPGAAGVYINGKRVKGNKKVYKTKLSWSGKKKGKKVTIKVYSYQSTKYKGHSEKASKKVKIRK